MNPFDNMVTTLTSDSFKDTDFNPISKKEYDIFCKEYVFQKLKGINFGTAFKERFNCNDRVLSMFINQKDVMTHIEYCKYVK